MTFFLLSCSFFAVGKNSFISKHSCSENLYITGHGESHDIEEATQRAQEDIAQQIRSQLASQIGVKSVATVQNSMAGKIASFKKVINKWIVVESYFEYNELIETKKIIRKGQTHIFACLSKLKLKNTIDALEISPLFEVFQSHAQQALSKYQEKYYESFSLSYHQAKTYEKDLENNFYIVSQASDMQSKYESDFWTLRKKLQRAAIDIRKSIRIGLILPKNIWFEDYFTQKRSLFKRPDIIFQSFAKSLEVHGLSIVREDSCRSNVSHLMKTRFESTCFDHNGNIRCQPIVHVDLINCTDQSSRTFVIHDELWFGEHNTQTETALKNTGLSSNINDAVGKRLKAYFPVISFSK